MCSTFSFCCLIYGNYYRLTKTYKVSRASQPNCGPAKPDFGWPDWPAKEKVKLDPCRIYFCLTGLWFWFINQKVAMVRHTAIK